MSPRLTTALLARPLATAAVGAIVVLGALPAAADPSDGATPAQTDDVFRPSTAVFQPPKCVAGKQNLGVTLTNGSGTAQTFLITSQGGTVSPSSSSVPANQSTTLTLHASGARQSIFVSVKGKSAGSMPLPGCTATSSSSSSPSRSSAPTSAPTTPEGSSSSARTGKTHPSASSSRASSSAGSSADSTDASDAGASGSTSDSTSGAAPSTGSAGASAAPTSAAMAPATSDSSSSTSNGPSPLMVTGGIVLAALGLTVGGVALFREFRR